MSRMRRKEDDWLRERLGKNLRFLRLKNNLSWSDMEAFIGASPSAQHGWEKAHTEPGIVHLYLFSKLYDVKLDDLFNKDLADADESRRRRLLDEAEHRLAGLPVGRQPNREVVASKESLPSKREDGLQHPLRSIASAGSIRKPAKSR